MSDEIDILEQDPMDVPGGEDRARVIFTQWHVDEVTDVEEAADYAARLIARLGESGVALVNRQAPIPPNPWDIAHWDLEYNPPRFNEDSFMNEVREYLANHDPWVRTDGEERQQEQA